MHLSVFPQWSLDAPPNSGRGDAHQGGKLMASGTVKFFNATKGFGFIQPEDGSKDIFVHISAVERSGLSGLAEKQRVSFDAEKGRDGRVSAVNLKLI
jgi:CspA family cold shock protein